MSGLDWLRALLRNVRLRFAALTVFAVAALLFLAAGLSQLELLPGQPLPRFLFENSQPGTIAGLPGGDVILFLIRAFYLIGLICLPFFVIYLILNPNARKQFFKDLLRVGALLLILYFAANFLRALRNRGESLTGQAGGSLPQMLPEGQFVQFVPQTPQWLIWTVSALLALLLAGLIGLILWFILRRKPAEQPLKRIAQEAQAAMDAIQSGGDLRNIVIHCYAEMSRVLSEQRGIQRAQHMTPREFEAALEGQGIPREPVHALTRVFEEIRYGAKVPGPGEERQALDSLAAIVAACGSQP